MRLLLFATLLLSPSPTAETGIPGSVMPMSATSLRGLATWYCGAGSPCTRGYPGGMYAAAGSELQVGDWRGSRVTVCASKCITVTLIDSCGCAGNRIIDLYREAFARLADPSRGVVAVTVESGGKPRVTLPPTSTAP